MASAVVQATLQSCVLTATSNIFAQCITAYRTGSSYTIDWVPVFQFVLFTALNCPPNFIWQQFLESVFPGQTVQPSKSAIKAAATNDEKELDREQASHELVESKLHIPNTAIKFVLDQTVGAALNTLAFILAMAAFKGANWNQALQLARQDFWPLIFAGWKLWPLISFVNYTLVKTVQTRTLIGSLAGMGWGIYLSLVAGGR